MKRFINDVKKYKDYIIYQTKAELKCEIIGSYLGWIWLFLEPLCFMLIYTFIAGVVFGSRTQYFPVFVFSGLCLWSFFKNTINTSVKLVNKNKDTVTKVYVPKFVLLIVAMCVNFFELIVTFGLLIVFMIFYRVPLSWNVLYVIPVLLCLIVLTFGFSSIFLHIGVFVEDLVNLTAIGLKFTFYLTGIFYDINKKVPKPYNRLLLWCNPMAYIISSFRNALIYSKGVDLRILALWLVVGIVLSVIGVSTIYKYENTYVKVMRG